MFAVKKEHDKGKAKLLHRNLLLPFLSIPSKSHKAISATKGTNKVKLGTWTICLIPLSQTDFHQTVILGTRKKSNTTQLVERTERIGETGHLDSTTQLNDNIVHKDETGHLSISPNITQLSDTGTDTGETGH